MSFDKQPLKNPRLWGYSLLNRLRSDPLLINSLYIMISTVVTAIIGYLYWIVAAHFYVAHDLGLASALISIMTLTSTLADLGVSSMLVQILPRRKTDVEWSLTLNAGLITSTLASILAAVIMIVVLPLFSHQFAILWQNVIYAIVFVVGVPLGTIVTLLDQAFVAERTASNILLRNVVFALIKLFLLVPLTFIGALGVFSSWVLALAIALILGGLLLVTRLSRTYFLTIRSIVRQVQTMFSSLAGHHFINLGGKASLYLLPVLVTVRLSPVDNAYYYTASMVGTFFFMVSASVAVSLFAEGSHNAEDVLHKAASSSVIIGMLLGPAMLISFLGGRYILLLFGPNYVQHALSLLTILTIAAVPDAITNIYVSILRIQKRLRWAALLNLGMALLSLTIAWVLLPILGILGAGLAFLIAQAVGSLIAGVDLFRYYRHSISAHAERDESSHEMANSLRPIPIYDYETDTSLLALPIWLSSFRMQSMPKRLPNTDNSMQRVPDSEEELSLEGMETFFDENTQTLQRIEVRYRHRSQRAFSNQKDHPSFMAPETIRLNQDVERWLERWRGDISSSPTSRLKLPERNTDE
jgi:O-antigen/teichoic acid export membrane protein